MRKFYLKGHKKNQYCTDILKIRIYNFMFWWFIDCGEWFIYLYFSKFSLRFSGAGFIKDKYNKKEHLKWLKEFHEFE